VESIVDFMSRTSCHRDVSEVDTAVRLAMAQEAQAALQAYLDGDEFVMPTTAHLVQARASERISGR